MQCLAALRCFVESHAGENICIVGDFNADPQLSTRFGCALSQFVEDCQLVVADQFLNSSRVTKTYQSDDLRLSSWIDHAICSSSMLPWVNDVGTIDDADNFSDHLPLQSVVLLPDRSVTENLHKDQVTTSIQERPNWSAVHDCHIIGYQEYLWELFANAKLPCHLVECDVSCDYHRVEIDRYLKEVTDMQRTDAFPFERSTRTKEVRLLDGMNSSVRIKLQHDNHSNFGLMLEDQLPVLCMSQ